MTFDIEINGRARRVEVEGEGSAFMVTMDGRRQVADVTVINGVWSLILGDRRVYEIAVVGQPADPGKLTVHVNGRLVSAVVVPMQPSDATSNDAKAGLASGFPGSPKPQSGEGGSRKEPAGPARITAPMPGKVVKLLVKPGDQVAARQGVIVVEAMKMENELRSPTGGTVIEVRVAEGALVDAGAVLVVIE